MLKSIVLFLFIFFSLNACTMLIPEYTRPAMPVQNNSYINGGSSEELVSQVDTSWQNYFEDENLKKLIEKGLENNKDLQLSALKVAELEASYRMQKTGWYPQIGASASASFNGLSSSPTINQDYSLGVDISYEIDFFGKVKSMSEDALHQYLATKSAQLSAKLILVSQIADSYINRQFGIKQLEIANKNLKNYEKSYEIIKARMKSGNASYLQIQQSLGLVELTKSGIIQIENDILISQTQLELLTGTKNDLNEIFKEDVIKFSVVKNIPSEVLLKRPDIIEAEHLLLASNANIGAARAAFFPSITLTGSTGFSSMDLKDLFSGGIFWQFMPTINIPIFNAGQNKINLDLANIRKESSVVQYEKVIQTAFKEVSDILISIENTKKQIETTKRYLETQRSASKLAFAYFLNGSSDYLQVLDAERSFFEAEQTLLILKKTELLNEINLFIALGGGLKE